MTTDTKIHKGIKLTPEEEKAVDPAKTVKVQTETPEVEGQWPYVDYVECPWCHAVGRAVLDSDVYVTLTCGACGHLFRK
jgi:hypothetical protein